ncbi:MAG: hypothetical protein JW783_05750 [Bacteroidales bacterium]|nr:hypothetical protein [Bacteroidales bacterium]MBN2749361.1 hypothetical protein [Bacteroidales bacterium]
MSTEQDYIRDIAEIRSMMERSSKFLSLSGWAGVMAGVYALVGAYIVHVFFGFAPLKIAYDAVELEQFSLKGAVMVAFGVLVLSVGTAVLLSSQRAVKRGESLLNVTSRRLVISSAVPLVAGGILGLIFMEHGLIGFLAPVTLVFYGLALYSAATYTYKEVRVLGLIQLALGLLGAAFVELGVLFWAMGFGLMHIVYGIYIHIKHER